VSELAQPADAKAIGKRTIRVANLEHRCEAGAAHITFGLSGKKVP